MRNWKAVISPSLATISNFVRIAFLLFSNVFNPRLLRGSKGLEGIEVVVHVDEDNSLGVMGNCATQPF